MIAKSGAALTRYLNRYNMSKDRYLTMLEQQGGCCAICNKMEPLVIDHDHACCDVDARSCGKCVRGLLCSPCNLFLGHANDNKRSLAAGIVYLYDRSIVI